MTSDFLEYSRSDENFSDEVYQISAGVNKNTTSSVVVSTWQSIVELKSSWLSQFDCVIVDECHGAKAKSFVKILEGMPHCKYRYGFTGTLSNNESKVNELVIQGLLGPSKTVVTTQELIGRDQLSDLEIFCCVFTYPDEVRKAVSKYRYADEKKWICSSRERNAAIVEVVKGLHGGVTLVLFEFVESHGEPLYSMIRESQQSLSEDDGPSREVFFVTGRIPPKKREEIRKIANSDRDCIIVASYGAYAVGINVPNIRNIVLASPTKSYIRLMQSIGRGLRKHGDKDKLLVVDIADNFKWGSKWNTTLDHFEKRVGMYSAQGFSYSVHRVFLNPSCSTCSNF
jgi:superfamily II DNA or RNA helicase